MKCITELKDWDFKIPELGFEKRVTLPLRCSAKLSKMALF